MTTGFFVTELAELREYLVIMGQDVNSMLQKATASLLNLDEEEALAVIKADKEINAWENRIVDRAIRLIATNQPVAGDLRFLASSLRLATELERLGDLGSNMARRTLGLLELIKEGVPRGEFPKELKDMVAEALIMLDKALNAFRERSAEQAEEVLAMDDDIDEFNRQIRRNVLQVIYHDGHLAAWGLEIINTSTHLERLGDHCTNLAEETIFMARGRNVRHHY